MEGRKLGGFGSAMIDDMYSLLFSSKEYLAKISRRSSARYAFRVDQNYSLLKWLNRCICQNSYNKYWIYYTKLIHLILKTSTTTYGGRGGDKLCHWSLNFESKNQYSYNTWKICCWKDPFWKRAYNRSIINWKCFLSHQLLFGKISSVAVGQKNQG